MPKHTPEPWVQGNCCDSIISVAARDPENINEGSLSHYGGHLVCESVSPRDRALIMAAPKLLKTAEALIKEFFCEEDEWPAKHFWDKGDAFIQALKDAVIEAGGSLDE